MDLIQDFMFCWISLFLDSSFISWIFWSLAHSIIVPFIYFYNYRKIHMAHHNRTYWWAFLFEKDIVHCCLLSWYSSGR